MNRLVAVLALVTLGWQCGWAQTKLIPPHDAGITNAPPAEIKEYTPIPPPIVMPPKPPEATPPEPAVPEPPVLKPPSFPTAEPSEPPVTEPPPEKVTPPKPAPPPIVKPPPPPEPPKPALPPSGHPGKRGHTERQWGLAAEYAQPASSDFWDTGMGGNVFYRDWKWDDWGWAISGGYSSWDSAPPTVPFPAEGYDPSMEGSATLYTLGASMVHRTPVGKDDTFLFEAGLRYIFFESDVVTKFNYENHYGQPTHIKVPVNVDDHLAAVINLMYEMKIDADLSWLVGLGYQLDLTGADTDWALETFDTATDGLRAQLGLVWKLD